MSTCSSTTPHRRKVALQGNSCHIRADTYHMLLPAFPSAEPGECAQSKAPVAEFCVGEDGTLLGDPHSGCSGLWLPVLQVHKQDCMGLPEEGTMAWCFESRRYGLVTGERKEGNIGASCLRHIKLYIAVSCGLKYPRIRVSQCLFSAPDLPCSCLTLGES